MSPRRVVTNSPELTINHGDTFLVTARDGQVCDGRHGLYHRDTRYLSRYHFTLNGADPVLLASTNTDFHRSRSYLSNPRLGGYRTELPEGVLLVVLDRAVGRGGLAEEWTVTNYARDVARFTFSLGIEPAFEDIFEVRANGERRRPRVVLGRWQRPKRILEYQYRNGDFTRALRLRFILADEPRYSVDNFEIDHRLRPRETWRLRVEMELDVEERAKDAVPSTDADRSHRLFAMPDLRSDHVDVRRVWDQAWLDLSALHLQPMSDGWVPAAGVPWYSTLFGRDSLIAAYQLMHTNRGPAIGTLRRLAELQADRVDPFTEAEPGKMPHEVRYGELAHFRKIPQLPSYTTADATLLYPIVLSEYWRWTGDERSVADLLPVAERCLDWARDFGDRDRDGIQEFMRSPGQPGYPQMGWKDSADALCHADGSMVEPPYALVELQGYWYDALVRMAELRDRLRRPGGDELRRDAEELRVRIEDRFWIEEEGAYAFALDGRKHLVRSIASNPGHLLWSGAVSRERAARLARRMLSDDMWSGWGIRTLSERNPAYSPISYHLGSVWPHDNALIATGCRRYGLTDELLRIAEGVFGAAARFEGASLPELWSGIARVGNDLPVPYLDANRPQAWAAGSVPLLVRALLGLEADPVRRHLRVSPALPRAFGTIELRDLPVLGARVSLRARETEFETLGIEGDVTVSHAAD